MRTVEHFKLAIEDRHRREIMWAGDIRGPSEKARRFLTD
jgi:hypothetical protein